MGGLSGKFPIDLDQIKDTFITGGVAVGGAVASRKGVAWLIGLYDSEENPKEWSPETKIWVTRILEVAGGIGLGVVVAKYGGKQDIGGAIAVGPVVLNLFDIVTEVLAGDAEVAGWYDPALAGRADPALAGMVNMQDWIPPGMFQPNVGMSGAAWTM